MALRSVAILALLASAAAQQNPFIPSTISANCSTYLSDLDSNTAVSACFNPLLSALQAFAPGANTTSASATTALNTLCQTNATLGCSQSTITSQLSSFYAACQAELTSSPNTVVKTTYDSLYVLVPLTQGMCSKDDSGTFCAAKLSNTSAITPSQEQSLQHNLYTTTSSANSTVYAPNTTTYLNTNLVFMFLNGSLSNSQLCTTCTRNILTPYITFESSMPYACGLNNSLLLAGQAALYNSVTATCGSNFLSGAVEAAGSLSSGLGTSAAPRVGDYTLSGAVSTILGVAALVAASL